MLLDVTALEKSVRSQMFEKFYQLSFSHSSIQQAFIGYLPGPSMEAGYIKYTVPTLKEFTQNLDRRLGLELIIIEAPTKVLIINVSPRDRKVQ